MHTFSKIISSLIIVLFIFGTTFQNTYSAIIDNTIYVNLTPESVSDDVTKFQKLFADLGLYRWSIDGNFETLKESLATFQVKNNLILNIEDEAAWYVWPKTYRFLIKTYWTRFETLYIKYFWEPQEVTTPLIWDEQYFVVTAYYSPLKWQKKYATWSYWWDIRLNGEWVRGAWWKRVHAGFIAAPQWYAFGTKIELDSLWVGVVEDRWWAIVKAWVRGHAYDRLDVWMWYGDAGLWRALNWWKRTVKWRFRTADTKITMNFSTNIPLSPQLVTAKQPTVQTTAETTSEDTITIEEPELQTQEENTEKTALEIPTDTTEEILNLYNISLEEKEYIDWIASSIESVLNTKYKYNNLKIVSTKNAVVRKIELIISKSDDTNMIQQLLYLKVLLKK